MNMANYLLYSITFSFFVLFVILYLTRTAWLPYLPIPSYIYHRLPSSSFQSDIDGGFSSSDFDLQQNVEGGDTRQGLDQVAKREVGRIMQRMRVGFDEARRLYMQRRFRDEGIREDGTPRDPKFVSFS